MYPINSLSNLYQNKENKQQSCKSWQNGVERNLVISSTKEISFLITLEEKPQRLFQQSEEHLLPKKIIIIIIIKNVLSDWQLWNPDWPKVLGEWVTFPPGIFTLILSYFFLRKQRPCSNFLYEIGWLTHMEQLSFGPLRVSTTS